MTTRSPAVRIGEWLSLYGAAEVPLARLLCDAHESGNADAVLYEDAQTQRAMPYSQLRHESARLAGALAVRGIGRGDRVAVLLPRSIELVVTLLAIWRIGAVEVPLFTAFGPDAVGYRLAHSEARAVITDTANRHKLADPPDSLRLVASVGASQASGDLDFHDAVKTGPDVPVTALAGTDPFILLYTSGTTGRPKGVPVPVQALASFHAYMHYGLDLRHDDVFWNVSDPGWGYGLWFGVVGALLLGQRMLLRNVRFDAEDTFRAVERHGITNLAGAPTVYRSLRAAGAPDGFGQRARLRAVSSAGEPLNPELVAWSRQTLGTPIHDHYGQSELGMIAGFAHHGQCIREPVPASMGTALPGYRLLVTGEDGREVPDGREGELAVDIASSPLYWFNGYFRDRESTGERFAHGPGLYLTADTAQAANGLLYFSSRADDVITTSGYRVGPIEVESALLTHPAVADVAVVGTRDDLRGEAVTAYVVLTEGSRQSDVLAGELQDLVRSRLSKHSYPRRVIFTDSLPRTPTGKVQRALLREHGRPDALRAHQPAARRRYKVAIQGKGDCGADLRDRRARIRSGQGGICPQFRLPRRDRGGMLGWHRRRRGSAETGMGTGHRA